MALKPIRYASGLAFRWEGVSMIIKNIYGIICLLIFSLFVTEAWPANILNSDSSYDINIAVTINENDYIMGKLEYSNHAPQCQLQLVTFNPIG